jgi:protein-S-isoprenylcysteine O-methyltransferase Ste14
MNPWYAKAAVLAGVVVMILIRAPHGQRSRGIKVVKSGKGRLETVLLTFAWIGFLVPLLWIATPLFRFADYSLHPALYSVGLLALAVGLGIFHRSHADLGTNWSITLEVRENHSLVTRGIYRRVRHPMYLGLLVYSLGQLLVLPNWVAGPSYLVPVVALVALRIGPEERMMREQFPGAWDEYAARTHRLVPYLW